MVEFYFEFQGKRWPHYNSDKVCDIRYGRIQGLKNLMQHFKNSNVMNQQVATASECRILGRSWEEAWTLFAN